MPWASTRRSTGRSSASVTASRIIESTPGVLTMSIKRRSVLTAGLASAFSTAAWSASRSRGPSGRRGRGAGGFLARDRRLHLRLSAGHDGDDPPGDHQRRQARGHARADGPVHQAARVPGRHRFRDVTAPNADTLYTTACFDVGKEPWVAQPARHEGPLLPVPDARRLDQRVPGPGQAHHGHRARRPTRSPARAGRARCRRA